MRVFWATNVSNFFFLGGGDKLMLCMVHFCLGKCTMARKVKLDLLKSSLTSADYCLVSCRRFARTTPVSSASS
jgi:hypothetical protein